MKQLVLGLVLGSLVTVGAIKSYEKFTAKTAPYKVGDCLRVLGDALIYQVIYVVGNTVEAETLEAGLFGKSRMVFENVGDVPDEVPNGYRRGTLVDAKCE